MNCELMLTYDTPPYMFNVYKNQLSRQTGSRNLMGSKMFPTIYNNAGFFPCLNLDACSQTEGLHVKFVSEKLGLHIYKPTQNCVLFLI
jgi:hypothetical protein